MMISILRIAILAALLAIPSSAVSAGVIWPAGANHEVAAVLICLDQVADACADDNGVGGTWVEDNTDSDEFVGIEWHDATPCGWTSQPQGLADLVPQASPGTLITPPNAS